MPSTNPSSFGPEYEALIHRAFASHHPIPIPCSTPARAKSLRHRIYAYIRALQKENIRMDLIEKARELACTVVESNLYLLHKRDSWDHVAIREALMEKKPEPAASGKLDKSSMPTEPTKTAATATQTASPTLPPPQSNSVPYRQSSHEARMAKLAEIRRSKQPHEKP